MVRFRRGGTRPDRTSLRRRVASTLLRNADRPGTLAVLFVDFVRVDINNASVRRPLGAEVLDAAVDRLRTVLRWNETPARFGGSKFVVLCDGLADPAWRA